MWSYIIIAIIAIILVYTFITYNNLINLKNNVNEAFATMDVYLKKRWDLIPNLVETVKGYAEHENSTLKEVIETRNINYDSLRPNEKVDLNSRMTQEISKLMIIAEAYPELQASANFKDLSDNLTKVEDEIASSRKYYNGSVRIMNDKIQMFPSNIIALIFNFKTYKMFEATVEERKNIKVEL